jgi:Tol biopolymer transport system component
VTVVLPTAGSSATPTRSIPALLTYVASNGGLCVVRADGTHAVRLTPRGKRVAEPSWSPRGRYVAMERSIGYDSNHDLNTKITVADDRGRLRWTFGNGGIGNRSPLWSPDGRNIAYFESWAHSGGLSLAHPNGSGDRGIAGCTGNPVAFCPQYPTWSADGRCLAFVDRPDLARPPGIFRACLDGSASRLLVPDASWPAYAPDGTKLAYIRAYPRPDLMAWSLFVADADGANPHAITVPSRDLVSWPSWSPDGASIAFKRAKCSAGRCSDEIEIAVVRADGTGERVVAEHVPLSGTGPAWSPSGRFIAFLRRPALVVARADGAGARTVVRRVGLWGLFSTPVWRPPVALPAAKRPACPRR